MMLKPTEEQKEKLEIVYQYAGSRTMHECILKILKDLQKIATPENKAAAMIWMNISKEIMNLDEPIEGAAWNILDSLVAGVELIERKK